MKILLIYPPVSIYGRGKVGAHLPLGLISLAAYIRAEGHEVRILDALAEGIKNERTKGKMTRFGLSDARIKSFIKKYQPDVVGVSVMFTAFEEDGLRTAGLAKSVNKEIVTILGGAHVSIDPKSIVKKSKSVDVAVKGEGELTLAELLKNLSNKSEWKNIDGIACRIKGKVIQNKNREIIRDLNELPLPAYDLLKINLYSFDKNPLAMRSPILPMVTSRGCPNHCVYCSIHALWEHKWRGKKAEKVVDEIEILMKKFGAREISFQDDSMSVDKVRFGEICDEIIRRKLDIKWTTPNGIAHWTLDKKLLEKMKKAGCYRITFGIESGNPEMRRWIGKPFSLNQAKELTKYANKLGMWTVATNIIGFPYETKEEVEDTLNYAINSDVDLALFFRLGPRKGTPVYEIFKKEGWLPKDEKLLFSEEVACETKNFKGDDLFVIQSKTYKKFLKYRLLSFLNPVRIIRKIQNIEDFKYVFGLGVAGLKLVLSLWSSNSGVTSKSLRV